MRKDKETALELRRNGKSYEFISNKLGIPISTLSGWLSRSNWSRATREELTQKAFQKVQPKFQKMAEINKRRWELWRNQAREEAVREFEIYKNDLLFCAGIMIYWGEGDKNPKNPVRVSNIDSDLLALFVNFLKKYAAQYKIRPHMILYPDLNEKTCKKYWSSKIKIDPDHFYKTQHIIGRHKTRRTRYGIGAVTISSRQLKEKILKWIELYSKQLNAVIV